MYNPLIRLFSHNYPRMALQYTSPFFPLQYISSFLPYPIQLQYVFFFRFRYRIDDHAASYKPPCASIGYASFAERVARIACARARGRGCGRTRAARVARADCKRHAAPALWHAGQRGVGARVVAGKQSESDLKFVEFSGKIKKREKTKKLQKCQITPPPSLKVFP